MPRVSLKPSWRQRFLWRNLFCLIVGALVYAGSCGNTGVNGAFITINDLMNAAVSDASCGLCVAGNTPAGNPCRATQECWKTTLDKANNNLNFVQPGPCPFSFNPPNCP